MPPHAGFSPHPPLAWDEASEAGKHLQPHRRNKGHGDPKGYIPHGDSEDKMLGGPVQEVSSTHGLSHPTLLPGRSFIATEMLKAL